LVCNTVAPYAPSRLERIPACILHALYYLYYFVGENQNRCGSVINTTEQSCRLRLNQSSFFLRPPRRRPMTDEKFLYLDLPRTSTTCACVVWQIVCRSMDFNQQCNASRASLSTVSRDLLKRSTLMS